jgi:hypothetical protein
LFLVWKSNHLATGNPSLLKKATASTLALWRFQKKNGFRGAEKSVLLKGTASAVPQVFRLLCGFSR